MRTVALLALVLLQPGLPTVTQTDVHPFDVTHYAARVEPDIASGSVEGTVAVSLVVTQDGLEAIELDRGSLTVDAVREEGRALPFEEVDRRVSIRLPGAAAAGERHEIEISYHGAPRYGMEFVPERAQVYTIFSTSQWLICVDAPADRATLELSVVLPGGLSAVANGRFLSSRPLPDGRVLYGWHQEQPVPTYIFGFAAGRFTEVVEQRGEVTLRYLGDGFSEAELQRLFADTSDMLSFFEDRAGMSYDDPAYTQALVADTIGQEMATFTLMSEDYGRRMLDDPASSSLAAHELAHQWWGNMVTCRDWTHFWLNEGFGTFMAAAWMEHWFGRDVYLREIEGSRERYERVHEESGDRSLVFPDWDRPTSADRTLVYHKGAYVLHLLREELGEDAFWDGVRHYTRMYFGRSVTTADFQAAMEESSGTDLSAFFDEWVYLR